MVATTTFFNTNVASGTIFRVSRDIISRFRIVGAFNQPFFHSFTVSRSMIVYATHETEIKATIFAFTGCPIQEEPVILGNIKIVSPKTRSTLFTNNFFCSRYFSFYNKTTIGAGTKF